ncbi:MAG TPA: dihydrodipicolinate synthase family protein [Candidatus Saccharimonadales bacterium]|nr:dihydrodipicolinate synthase family protein [Candidatus Saccharimonadales bacterium]
MSDGPQFNGIITALVTPFSLQGQILEESLRELIRFQLRAGVHGLFPCGTTGMGPVMSVEQRKKVAELVVREARGQVPVIVQIGAANPKESFELALHAEGIGATAVASLTPFFYQPGEDAIVEYFRELTRITSLPMVIYNIPRHTGNNIDPNLLLRLTKLPHVTGIKDSSSDFSQLVGFLGTAPAGFNVISGTDSFLFSALCAGAKAGVSAVANAFPEIFVRMYEHFRAEEYAEGRELQLKIHRLRGAVGKPPLSPILEALKIRGLKSGTVKPPLRPMNTQEIGELRTKISNIVPDLPNTA